MSDLPALEMHLIPRRVGEMPDSGPVPAPAVALLIDDDGDGNRPDVVA